MDRIGLSFFYDKIIKGWFIKKCKRILNLHNNPLPKYRGVSPINRALKNNEEAMQEYSDRLLEYRKK